MFDLTQHVSTELALHRWLPIEQGFNSFLFAAEESLGVEASGGFFGFNAPSGLPHQAARDIATIVSDVFGKASEPDYVKLPTSTKPGILEKMNDYLPEESRAEIFTPTSHYNYDNVITLRDLGLLGGIVFQPGNKMYIILGLTSPVCGLRSTIHEAIKPTISRAITTYCSEKKTSFHLLRLYLPNQFMINKLISQNKINPHARAFEHLAAWISPEGMQKIEFWLQRFLPHISSFPDDLYLSYVSLNLIRDMHIRQMEALQQMGPLTHENLGELFLQSRAWMSEGFGKLGFTGTRPSFHTHAE